MVALFQACASSGGGISIEQFPQEPPLGNEYIIGVGDTLSIQVYNEDKISGRMKVRSDGRITISLVGELLAAGKTPVALQAEIETGLKALLNTPRVAVVVDESSPLSISVLGEVARPGMQVLARDAGVAQALAAAGGLTAFAHKNRIYVNRPGQPQRIRFSYDDLLRGVGRGPAFRLRLGDVIVVD